MADDVVVIAKGSLIAAEPVIDFLARSESNKVKVRTNDSRKLAESLTAQGLTLNVNPDGSMTVSQTTTDRVGQIAFAAGVPLLELALEQASLEQVFLELTDQHQQYRVGGAS